MTAERDGKTAVAPAFLAGASRTTHRAFVADCGACGWSCWRDTEAQAKAAADVHALIHAKRSTARPTW